MELHEKIQRLAREQRLNQASLARESGIAPATMGKWFRGESVPQLYEAAKIAGVLGVSLDFLADDSLDEPPVPDLTEPERAVITTMRGAGLEPERAIQAIVFFATYPPGTEIPMTMGRRVEMAGPSKTARATKPKPKKSGKPGAKPVRDHEGTDPKNIPGGVR